LLTLKQTGDGIDQHLVRRARLRAAGFFERHNTLYPPMALDAGGPVRALPPQHTIAQCPLRAIVGRVDTLLRQEPPQRGPRPEHAADQPAGIVVPLMIAVDPVAQPPLPG
jgi:hypothetical protein